MGTFSAHIARVSKLRGWHSMGRFSAHIARVSKLRGYSMGTFSAHIARVSKLRGHSMGTFSAHIARVSKLRGHSMGTFTSAYITRSARGTGVCTRHEIIHSEITSEAIFGHKHNSFSLTCMLASRPHESDCTC